MGPRGFPRLQRLLPPAGGARRGDYQLARRPSAASARGVAPSKRRPKPSPLRRGIPVVIAGLGLVGALATWGWMAVAAAGSEAVSRLADDPTDTPVEVYAAPAVVGIGRDADLGALQRELAALGYREVVARPRAPGEYRRDGAVLEVFRRAHQGPAGAAAAAYARIEAPAGRVLAIRDGGGGKLSMFVFEPVRLGAFRGPVLQERRPLTLDEFPPQLVQAVLAAEDARFLDHAGVDPIGVLRAAWYNATSNGPLQGGSTITQQVIKNRVVGTRRTVERKLREALLAAYVEGRVTKERILEIYLNEIYLGQRGAVSVVGIPAGALFYFGRDVRELQLPEMAMLAGLIASPGRFDPRGDGTAARDRRNWVLGRMAEVGFIDRATADAARRAPLELAPLADPIDPAGDVLDAVRRELRSRGIDPVPGRDRVAVHTTIDPGLQEAARQALTRTLAELERNDSSRAPLEGAIVVLDPATGALRALVGGRTGIRGGFHRALDARRQPGSAFKPFVALAAFEERGVVPSTRLLDEPLTVTTPQGPWSPQNYDREYRGAVTVREMLEESLNVPAVRLGLEVGRDAVAEWARRAGLHGNLPPGPAIALGTGETAPLDLATAYATVAALGRPVRPTLVRTVRRGAAGGAQPLDEPVPEAGLGVDPIPAWLLLDAMSGTALHGTARRLSPLLGPTRVAAKTGTSQGGRDAWFVLVTGRAVTVAWVGRDDARPAGLTGAGAALPVVERLIAECGDALLAPLPPPPEGVVELEIDPGTGGQAVERCPSRIREVFREGAEPGPCREHLSFWKRLFGGRGATGRSGGAERR